MTKPLFSIIMPVYNVEHYLSESINSILMQSGDWELIIVDDGSCDNSSSICDYYKKIDNRINVFHKNNDGVSSARNYGIEKATGKYIVFVDSDDVIDINFLSIIQGYLNDDIDLIHYGWYYIDGKQTFRHDVCKVSTCLTLKEVCRKNIFHGFVWSYVFKSDIIKDNKLHFLTNLDYAEDWEFILKYYLYVNKMLILEDCLYSQVMRPGSATNRELGEKYIGDNFEMYRRVMSISSNYPKYIRNFYKRRIKDINMWMVNNVLFKNKPLLSRYKAECEKLYRVYKPLTFSIMLWTPLFLGKNSYKFICMLYNKANKYPFIQNIM
jgi:glycosyltransferase involved in cell wall biosynthesis